MTKFKSNSQMQYQIIYIIWLLSFEKDIVGLIDRQYNLTPIFVEIAQNSIKEKVVRVIASTFKVIIRNNSLEYDCEYSREYNNSIIKS